MTAEAGAPSRLRELEMGVWDAVVIVATVFLAAVMPLEVVFDSLEIGWVAVLSGLVSVVIGVDVVMRLSGAADDVRGIDGVQHGGRSRYLRTWFTIDVLAAIPFELLAIAPGFSGSSLEGPLRFLALLRVLRISRVLFLQRDWRVRTSLNPALLRLSFFAFWILMISHWIACGWIALDGTVVGLTDLHPYQQALYWTITTLTTVGYGDLTPEGSTLVGYTMVVMALGAAMYGYIIGNVASLIANLDVVRSRHLNRLESINTFMRDRNVPRELQGRVRNYYNYVWENRMGSRQQELLADLPTPLHVELSLHLTRPILEKVPLFEGADETVLRELALHLEPTVYVPGQNIVLRGERGDELFFIDRGRVEVRSYDDTQIVAVLGDGDFFGEMALLESQPRANTVRALDYCNVYTLDRQSFERVLEGFPEFAAAVRAIAERRKIESDSMD